MHGIEKRIVYVLRSDADAGRHYVGITNDLRARLDWHNHGPGGHTRAHRPWSVVVSIEFSREREAVRFEKYLKSGSGRAFALRHLAPCVTGNDSPRTT
jgi:predicted GIY-YIG superfamily endonuclease